MGCSVAEHLVRYATDEEEAAAGWTEAAAFLLER